MRLAVRAPTSKSGRVAQSGAVDLVVSDLDDPFGPDGHPVLAHPGHPPSGRSPQPAERTAAGEEALLPRMALERRGKWRQRPEELVAHRQRKTDNDADVLQPGRLTHVVHAEHQGRDERPSVRDRPKASDHAIGSLLVLDLDHGPRPRRVAQLDRLGHDAVDAGALIAAEPALRDTDVTRRGGDE